MAEADRATPSQKQISDDLRMYTRQGKGSAGFLILDKGKELHRSYNANN